MNNEARLSGLSIDLLRVGDCARAKHSPAEMHAYAERIEHC